MKNMLEHVRVCYACGSDRTANNQRGYPNWLFNKPTNLLLCNRCYQRYIINPTLVKRWNGRHMWFKGKNVMLKQRRLIGVCNWCRAVVGIDCKMTAMHHEQYDESDPLKHSIELCQSCHTKTFKRKGYKEVSTVSSGMYQVLTTTPKVSVYLLV